MRWSFNSDLLAKAIARPAAAKVARERTQPESRGATPVARPMPMAIVLAIAAMSGLLSPDARAQLLREDFDHPAGASGYVEFRGHTLYTVPVPGPSTGGDATGNVYQDAMILTNFDTITNDQSGNGYFLMSNTRCVDTNDFRGEVWGTLTPVPVTPNETYVFSFYLTNRNTISNPQIEPRINGQAIAPAVSAAGTWPAQQWQRFSFEWTAPAATPTADLSLFNLTQPCGGNDFGIDTIALSVKGCGDGIVQPELGETCDDGNVNCCDGCDTFCQQETCGAGDLKSLYVLGIDSSNVVHFDASNQALIGELVHSDPAGMPAPVDVAIGPNGNLYVLLHSGGQVLEYDKCTGASLGTFVAPGTCGLGSHPHGMTFGPDGDLYVLSLNPQVVIRFDGTSGACIGPFGSTAGELGNSPEKVGFSPAGDLYVAGYTSQRVYRFNALGAPRPTSGRPGAEFAAFTGADENPTGLAFDAIGNVYVAVDPGANGSIWRFDAATGTGTRIVDPDPSVGGLKRPTAMAFYPGGSPGGELYVTHRGGTNSVLRYTATAGAPLSGFAPQGTAGLVTAQSMAFSCACNCPGVSDIAIAKSVNTPNPIPGASVTFQIAASNAGPQTASNVVVLDVLPPGLTYVSHTINGAGAYDPVTGRFTIPSLSAQTPVILNVSAVVDTCLPVTNCAALSTLDGVDHNSSNNSACATVTPVAGMCSTIGGIKFGDLDRDGIKDLGEPLIEAQTMVLKKGKPIVQTLPTLTDGSYTFQGVTPGTYSITEVLQPGQIVITPPTGTRTVKFSGAAPVTGRDFGNYTCGPDAPITCIRPPKDMVEWWPLDTIVSGSGGCAYTIGKGRRIKDRVFGSPVGATTCGVTPTGAVDGAIVFGGVDDYVEAADHAALDFAAASGAGKGDFSIDAWIRTTSSAPQVIVDKLREVSGTNQGYSFYTENGILMLKIASAGVAGTYSSGSPLVNTGEWIHVAVTVNRDDAAGVKFYVNGDPSPNTPNPTAISGNLGNNRPLRIGGRSDSASPAFFTGGIDEVEIFRRVLTEQEIRDIKTLHKCKRPRCNTGQNVKLCKDRGSVKVAFKICNLSGVPDTFKWSVAGSPTSDTCTATPTRFVPVGGVTPVLNPGGCKTFVISVGRPAGLVAPGRACFQMTFTNTAGECFHCNGSVKASDRFCTKQPPVAALQAALPVTLDAPARHVEFVVENTQSFAERLTGDPDRFDYRFVTVPSDPAATEQVVSLNGLPPGVPVSGSIVVVPGASQTIGVDVEYTMADLFEVTDLVLEADADGDGTLEGDDSIGLESVLEGAEAESDACSGLLPSAGIDLGWESPSLLNWSGEACSSIYNVYRATTTRLVDANQDGLADDYGGCFDPELTVPESYDDSVPPVGSFHGYLVTGENAQGEGTLGTNYAGTIRPLSSPCP